MYLDLSGRNINNNNIEFYQYRQNIKPTVIDLSHNNIGKDTIENVLLLLDNYSKINELNFSWNELEYNSITQLSNWLSHKNIELLNINLHNFTLQDVSAIIPIFNYVKSIDISNSLLDNNSLILITDNIPETNLLELKIGNNLYTNIEYLLKRITKNNSLNSLCIYNSKLNNNNFNSLLELLLVNKNIVKLNIGNNDFTIDKLLLLIDIVNNTKKLQYLGLKNLPCFKQINTNLLNDSFNKILHSSSIVELDISHNNNKYDNYYNYLNILKDNDTIQHLNMKYCHIDMSILYNMMRLNHNITTLYYTYHNQDITNMLYYNKIYNNKIETPKKVLLFRNSIIISLYQLLTNEILEELSSKTIKQYILYLKYLEMNLDNIIV